MTVGMTKLRKMLKRQKGCCAYCKRGLVISKNREAGKLKPNEATLDHVMPKHSGWERAGNEVVACHECNHLKGPLDGKTFRELRGHPEKLREAVKAKHAELQGRQ